MCIGRSVYKILDAQPLSPHLVVAYNEPLFNEYLMKVAVK